MSAGGEGNGGGNNRGRNSDSQIRMFSDGLNSNRQKGFGAAISRKIETPTLNDMRARQGRPWESS